MKLGEGFAVCRRGGDKINEEGVPGTGTINGVGKERKECFEKSFPSPRMWPLVLQSKHVAKSLFLFFFSHYPLPRLREIKTTTMLLLAMGKFICPFVRSPPKRTAALTSGEKVSSENDSSPLSPLTHTRERKNRLFFSWHREKEKGPTKASSPFSSSPSILLRLPPPSLPESVVVGGRISPPFLSPSPFA